MHNIWKLFCYDVKHLFGNVITVVLVLGLVFLPSIFTWYNVIACWNVFDNTGELKVAVANSDEGFESELLPTKINVGDSVESALRENTQLDWVFTTEEDAIDGAKSGKYYAAVVIPENFSRDMMSFYSADTEHAQIIYYENEKKNAVAPRVTDQASTKVSSQVNTTFAETLSDVALSVADTLGNLAESGDADGYIQNFSNTVANSATQMNSAADVLDAYAGLVSTAQALVGSSTNLLDQAQSAVKEAEGSADTAKDGAGSIGSALQASVTALSGALDQSASSFSGVSESVDQVYANVDGASADAEQSLRDQASDTEAQIERYKNLKTQLQELESQVDSSYQPAIEAAIKQIDASIASMEKLHDSLIAAADDIAAGNVNSQANRSAVKQKVADAQASVQSLADDYNDNIKPGLESLASSVSQAAQSLSCRASLLSGVGNDLESSANEVSGKLSDAQGSIKSMADELRSSAAKLNALSTSIDEALASGNVDQLKEIIGSDPSALAKAVSAPVGVERIPVFAVNDFGSAMAPLYSTLALWVGALLMMVLMNPVPSERARAQLDNPKSWQLFFGRFGAMAVIELMQSSVMCLGNMLFLGVQVSDPILYLLCFWTAGLVFGFIIYTLVSLFANLGKAIAVLLLIVQVTGGGGSFPLQMLPEFFQMISPFLPATHIISAMRAASMGVYMNDIWIELLCELSFVVPFAVLGLMRPVLSKVTYKFVEKVEESKLVS